HPHACSPHMSKRTIRLTHPKSSCKRSFILLHLHLPPHWTRPILRLLLIQRNLKHRSNPPPHAHSNRLRRLRTPMRSNIILRSNCYHKFILSNPLYRTNPSRMSLRRILSRQPNPYPILRPTLSPPLCNRRNYSYSTSHSYMNQAQIIHWASHRDYECRNVDFRL
uniref:Uncharacterized protein n=1 Tax=Pavo cristatus TaxID=9049 RepID=A0A8C9EZQ4_PAVCR